MNRRTLWLSAACILFGTNVAMDATACGDKLLVVGRGARFQRGYVAVYPASVLLVDMNRKVGQVVVPLRRAGHRVDVVEDASQLRNALAANTYDVVLGDWRSAAEIQPLVSSITPSVSFVPVLEDASRAEMEAATKLYGCPLESKQPKVSKNFLARLDTVIESRRKSKPLKCDVE